MFKCPDVITAEDPSQECPSSAHIPGSFFVTNRTDRTWIVDALKQNLKNDEIAFKSQYCYGTTAYGSTNPSTGTMEDRHCITALSGKTISWKEKSSGIMWVGVYGMDDICVVTLSGNVDWKRVRGCLVSTDPETVLSIFRKCVLSELEDLAHPPSKLREELDRSFDTPFCVVSATPGTPDESDHETSSAAHPDDAVYFVRGSGLLEHAKDSGGAIKLAICAFQRLMGKKFEAEEIAVTVLFGRNFGSGYTRELEISEIGDYLAAVEAIMV